MTELERALSDLPDTATVPVSWIRKKLRAGSQVEHPEIRRARWIRIGEAAEITGIGRSTLRASAPRWRRMMERYGEPPVRVRKAGDSARSPWLFEEADCWAYRRKTGGGPRRLETPATDPGVDERDSIIAHYTAKATANL